METILGYKNLPSPHPCPWNEKQLCPEKRNFNTPHQTPLWIQAKTHDAISRYSNKMGRYDEANDIQFNCVVQGGKCTSPYLPTQVQ